MKVWITGGSGLVGSKLTQILRQKGIEVVWLSRKAGLRSGIKAYAWDYEKEYIDMREKYEDDFVAEMGAEAVQKLLKEIDLETLAAELKEELKD